MNSKLKPILLHKIDVQRMEQDCVEQSEVLVYFTLQLNGTTTTGAATLYKDGSYIEAFWSRPDTWLDSLTRTRLQALTWTDYSKLLLELQTSVTNYILGRESCDQYQSTHTTRSSFLQAPA